MNKTNIGKIILSVVAIAAALSALLWFVSHNPRQEKIPDESGQKVGSNPVVHPANEVSRQDVISLNGIRFVDRLDNDLGIPVDVVVLQLGGKQIEASDELGLAQGISRGIGPGIWEVKAPAWGDSQVVRAKVSESITPDSNVFALPFRSGIRVDVRNRYGQELNDPIAVRWCCVEEKVLKGLVSAEENLVADGLWGSQSFEATLTNLLESGAKIESGSAEWSSRDEVILLENSGSVLIWASAPGYGQAWATIYSVPGEIADAELLLPMRPTVFGQVRDEAGRPMPNEIVNIGVSFGANEIPDFSEFDSDQGAGLIAAGLPGAMKRTARIAARTDDDGRYSAKVPRGEFYSVSMRKDASFGISQTTQLDYGQLDRINLDLDLIGLRNNGDDYYLLVQDTEGNPIEGASVLLAIVDDIKLARHFPELLTDSEGRVAYPWIEPGTLVSPFISIGEELVRPGTPYLELEKAYTILEVNLAEQG